MNCPGMSRCLWHSCRHAKGCSALEQKTYFNLQLACAKHNWLWTWLICISWCPQAFFDVLPKFSLALFCLLSLNWGAIEYRLQKHLANFGNCTNYSLLNLLVLLWKHQSPGLGEVEERDLHTNYKKLNPEQILALIDSINVKWLPMTAGFAICFLYSSSSSITAQTLSNSCIFYSFGLFSHFTLLFSPFFCSSFMPLI